MKLKIKERFVDKYFRSTIYDKGTIVNFEDERAKELLKESPHLVEKYVLQSSQTRKKKKADATPKK